MSDDSVTFALSAQTDVEFQKALAILSEKISSGWRIVAIRRDTAATNAGQVPIAVIDIEL